MEWKQAIREWRALPDEEQRRRRRVNLPLKVARSMAFAGEPVDLADLMTEPAMRPMPMAPAKPNTNI
jgi:hypothetical protein